MTLFEQFVAEHNERADELGEMAQIRASTVQQEREEVHAALQYAAIFGTTVKSVRRSRKAIAALVKKKVRPRSIVRSGVQLGSSHRIMRCRRNSENMKMPGRCEGPKWMEMERRVDPNGTLVWCRNPCLGPELMNRCRPERKDTKEHGNTLNFILKQDSAPVHPQTFTCNMVWRESM